MSHLLHIDMSNPSEKSVLFKALSGLRGMYSIDIKQARKLRSSAQNRLYWAVYVAALRNHLLRQGEVISDDLVHELYKNKFLRRTLVDQGDRRNHWQCDPLHHRAHTVEFNEYLDKIQAWLSDSFGIELPGIRNFRGTAAGDRSKN
jgi:hypothetical protein